MQGWGQTQGLYTSGRRPVIKQSVLAPMLSVFLWVYVTSVFPPLWDVCSQLLLILSCINYLLSFKTLLSILDKDLCQTYVLKIVFSVLYFYFFQWSLLMRATFSFWWSQFNADGRIAFNIKPVRSSVIIVPDDFLLRFSHNCVIFYFPFRHMIHFESFLPKIWDMKFPFSFIFVAYKYLLVLALCDEKDHYSCIELHSELHKTHTHTHISEV